MLWREIYAPAKRRGPLKGGKEHATPHRLQWYKCGATRCFFNGEKGRGSVVAMATWRQDPRPHRLRVQFGMWSGNGRAVSRRASVPLHFSPAPSQAFHYTKCTHTLTGRAGALIIVISLCFQRGLKVARAILKVVPLCVSERGRKTCKRSSIWVSLSLSLSLFFCLVEHDGRQRRKSNRWERALLISVTLEQAGSSPAKPEKKEGTPTAISRAQTSISDTEIDHTFLLEISFLRGK